MAVTGKRGVGIPSIVLHEGEGTIVTIELKSNVVLRGRLEESEDNFNCHMRDVLLKYPDGKESTAPAMFIRGSQIRMVILPDVLKHAPMFKRIFLAKKGKQVAGGLGRGRTEAIRAKALKKAVETGAPVNALGSMIGGPPRPPPGFMGVPFPGGMPPMGPR